MNPKVTWECNKDTEINRLVFTAGNIARGFYQRIGAPLFTVLKEPTIPNIHFPIREIDSNTWNLLKSNNYELFSETPVPQRIIREFEEAYSNIEIPSDKQVEKLKNDFKAVQSKFFKIADALFDNFRFTEMEIMPTLYGIGASYMTRRNKLYIYFRIDTELSILFSLIIKAQVQNDLNIIRDKELKELETGRWYNKEHIAEYIMQFSPLGELFPEHRAFLDNYKNPELNLAELEESRKNYRKLGFPVDTCIKKSNQKIFVYDNETENLTPTEFTILSKLLENENEIIKFEDIAEIIWGENYYDKFSLNAIAKQIFRLREKLKGVDLQKEVIFTKRGKGYVLVQ